MNRELNACLTVLFGLALLISSEPVSAAKSDVRQIPFDEIVVVANKVPRSIHSIAANVSVLSKQEIKESMATSTTDLFQYTPGIDTETSGVRFGTEGINIRGIGGNRVALVIDGVPLSDQFDIGNFSNATRDFINAGLIERAEILHGPASTLYGSDAIGGVIAMYTPDPVDIFGSNSTGGEVLTTYRDADNSRHVQALYAKDGASLDFIGAISWRGGSEFKPVEEVANPDLRDYQRQSVMLKMVSDDQSVHNWRLGYIHQASEAQSDLNSMLGSGRFRSTTSLLGDDESSMDLVSFEYQLGFLEPWFDSSLLRAYHLDSEVQQRTLDERKLARTPVAIDRLFAYQQDTNGLELNIQKELKSRQLIHQFGFGLEIQYRTTEELRDGIQTNLATGESTNTVLGETFPLRDFPESETRELGAYFEYSLSSDVWTLIAALRADRYKLTATPDAIYREDNPQTNVVSLSESDVSPKLGLILRLTSSSDIYMQYAHGFRAPPFEDANIGLDIPLFNIRAVPNPDLQSESSNGVDIGYRWYAENAKFHVGYFRTRYQDFIETKVRLGEDPVSGRLLFQSQNLSAAQISGLEAGWQVKLPRNLDFNGSVYVADGSNKENNQPLNSVGPGQLVMGLRWSSKDGRRSLRVRGTHTTTWDDRDQGDDDLFIPDSYSLVDLYYSERLSKNLVLRAGVQNLTDKKYWNWSDIRQVEADDSALPILARPGRQFSLSLNLDW